jgi:FAD/FMN-containing dehydrogenase
MKITSVISNLQKYLKHSTLIQVKDSLTRYALHDITPLATLACHDIGDLQTTVKFCNESNIDYVVKAGGTNQSNSSIRQNCLVLDLSFLKQISHTFDQKSMKINIQAGVTFGHL